jgi:hypothetical protein
LALYGGRLSGTQELGDGHAPHQAKMRLARRQRVEPDVFLHDKFLLILRVLLQGPLAAFIALVGAASEDQDLYAVLRCWCDRPASYWYWNNAILRVLVALRLNTIQVPLRLFQGRYL